MQHTISCLVGNRQGILADIVGGIAKERINIHSVAVSETEDVDTSRMTLVVDGGEHTFERIVEHIGGLEGVLEVEELPEGEFLSRQMLLIKVKAQGEDIARVMQVAEMMHATVLDVGHETMTLELTGEEEQMRAIVRMLQPQGILDLARSGRIAVRRGD